MATSFSDGGSRMYSELNHWKWATKFHILQKNPEDVIFFLQQLITIYLPYVNFSSFQ